MLGEGETDIWRDIIHAGEEGETEKYKHGQTEEDEETESLTERQTKEEGET